MEYYIHLAILCGMYLILAQSFNLVFGLGRLLNLAHIAVFGIGSYATALLATEGGYSFWVCLPASIIAAAIASLPIAAVSLKLGSDYFAVGTLALSALITALFINWKSITHGVLGIAGIPRPVIWGMTFDDNSAFLGLTGVIVAISFAIMLPMFRGRFGRVLRSQAEHPPASQSLGKAILSARFLAFAISSAFAGVAGCLFSYYMSYIDPSSFMLMEMVFVVSMVVVGRPGSFWGVTFGTIFLVLLPEPLRFVELPSSILGPMRQLLNALILLGVVYWNRKSLFPPQRTV